MPKEIFPQGEVNALLGDDVRTTPKIKRIRTTPVERNLSNLTLPALVYIQTQHDGFRPLTSGDAFYGMLIGMGRDLNYLIDPNHNEDSSDVRTPDYHQAVDLLHDGVSGSWFHYDTSKGTKLLVYGFNLGVFDTGLEEVTTAREFPRRYSNQLRNQLLVHTRYLDYIGAEIYFDDSELRPRTKIQSAMRANGREVYARDIRRLNKKLTREFLEDFEVQRFREVRGLNRDVLKRCTSKRSRNLVQALNEPALIL